MPGSLAGPWRARQDHRAVRGGFAAALLSSASAASGSAAPRSPAGLRARGAAQPAVLGARPALQETEVVLPRRAVRFRRLSAGGLDTPGNQRPSWWETTFVTPRGLGSVQSEKSSMHLSLKIAASSL